MKRFRTPIAVYNRVNLHIAVSEAPSLFGFFSTSGNPCSHFYVRRDGTVEQYVDTRYRAAADLEGNDATISVETQGMGPGVWTEAQVLSLAALFAWAVRTHGIRPQLATDSMAGRDTSKGLSWHRLGIDPWRVAGGMRYSSSRGKTCPGDDRIGQIPAILAMATGTAAPPHPPGGLVVDGLWGPATTRRAQQVLGTPVDGAVSSQWQGWRAANPGLVGGWQWVAAASGSLLVRAVQARTGAAVDGLVGPATITALQRHLGTPADGTVSRPSTMVRALQARLGEGRL
ncbi:MAG: N-acetylmuramoyl-L-alanine amidase [Micrococcales bacterium]|nr:N-acetylmuramoyl-L-alanine amidase [Micrococcales bacterium]